MSNYYDLPKDLRVTADISDYQFFIEQKNDYESRRLYLRGEIRGVDNNDSIDTIEPIDGLVDMIRFFNRKDKDIPIKDRTAIRLFIDSPGGDSSAGFKLVDAIEASETPVYTINESRCYSMAFLIFICGSKRFSTPKATFLMHDGVVFFGDSTNKALETAEFIKKFEGEVVKNYILKYSKGKMTEGKYDEIKSKEYYMLTKEAMEHGFLDEIISSENNNCSILY